MRTDTADRVTLNGASQALLRILIASYFLAVAFNLIPGTDMSLLFAAVLPSPLDEALASAMVFLLAYMIMIALFTRVAALILGIMTFYASYLTMVQLGVARELGAFWRDLALIAALVLTYSDGDPHQVRRARQLIRRRITPRRVAVNREAVPVATPRPAAPRTAVARPLTAQITPPAVLTQVDAPKRKAFLSPEIENIFADLPEEDTLAA